MRLVLIVVWCMPLTIIAGLLYQEFAMPSAALPETNRAMRERMCREHLDLARSEPGNGLARQAVGECLDAGYLTRADGLTAIE